jgi:hypothetical protein
MWQEPKLIYLGCQSIGSHAGQESGSEEFRPLNQGPEHRHKVRRQGLINKPELKNGRIIFNIACGTGTDTVYIQSCPKLTDPAIKIKITRKKRLPQFILPPTSREKIPRLIKKCLSTVYQNSAAIS